MKKSGANDNRSGKHICIALAFAFAFLGNTYEGAAAEKGSWPRATYYTVVARAGDTVGTIAARYRASPAFVVKLNGLGTSESVAAGRVVLIPATSRATRAAVLSEAMDRSAPNYATRPGTLAIVHFAVAGASAVKESPPAIPRVALESRVGEAGKSNVPHFSWPIAGQVISSFGPGAQGTRNEGVNIAANRGAPFRAAADGTVSFAGPLRGYGNLILITHSHDYITAYAHADSIAVARGELVEKGQVIGTAGSTGGVDRPQLHFEIRRGVTPIDPGLLLAANS